MGPAATEASVVVAIPPVEQLPLTPQETRAGEVTAITKVKYANLGREYNELKGKEKEAMLKDPAKTEVRFYHTVKNLGEGTFYDPKNPQQESPLNLREGQPLFVKQNAEGKMVSAKKGEPGALQVTELKGREKPKSPDGSTQIGDTLTCSVVRVDGTTVVMKIDTQIILDSQIIASYDISKGLFTPQEQKVIEAFIAGKTGDSTKADALDPNELKEAGASAGLLSAEAVVSMIDKVAPEQQIPADEGPEKDYAVAYNEKRAQLKKILDGKAVATSGDVTKIMSELALLSLPQQQREIIQSEKELSEKVNTLNATVKAAGGISDQAHERASTEIKELSDRIENAKTQVDSIKQAQELLSQPDNPVTQFFQDIDDGLISPAAVQQINELMKNGKNDELVAKILEHYEAKQGPDKEAQMMKVKALMELAPALGGGAMLLMIIFAMQSMKNGQ